LKDFLDFEETIYFSLLDLELHTQSMNPSKMLEINQSLLEESFSSNFETDAIKLKSLMESVKENIEAKGKMPHQWYSDLINWN